ncbi:MAG: mismatch repair protein MutT [Acidobacteria bacterium]|nr:mismatch repair protein MutT [Acidobacteriota bacterium]
MKRFDEGALERLRAALAVRPVIEIDAPEHRRACVLIPLVRNGAGWSLLFSRRSEQLQAHSGQIAFPGGAVEPGEPLIAAAVREAQEEVGIPPQAVEIIGRLDDVITNSGFLVAPFAGVLHEPVEYVLQASEVTEVFEVPLEALLSPANPEVRHVAFRNRRYPAYFYHHGAYEIWGLTGAILKSFLDVVWTAL